jgi:hypothetical protein
MNLTKNAKGDLYDGVEKTEKWAKYLMKHLHEKRPTPPEIEALIRWSETTKVEIKQYVKIIEDTSWRTSDAINY